MLRLTRKYLTRRSASTAMTCAAVAIVACLSAVGTANAKAICPLRAGEASACARACNSERDLKRRDYSADLRSGAQMNAMRGMKGMAMKMQLPAAADLLMREASGTSVDPAPARMPMRMKMLMRSGWNVGLMGNAFLTDTQQSGPRGGDKLYSTSAFMISAEHAAGRGAFLVEGMFSLEPATVTERRYPLLFQTGETAFGAAIEDGQHPHNFVMGLGAHYARPVGNGAIFEAYFAPVGDPALGPVAYPHRASAAELPEAPIGHHWEDSTHISYDVVSVGIRDKFARVEASGFHGAEPDEHRWEVSAGAIDSWSGRVSVFPSANWVAQVSAGRLAHPEALETGDVVRTTASVEYSRAMEGAAWSSSFVFGRNHMTATGKDTDAFLVESLLPFRQGNFFTGRWELVDKDELFAAQPAIEQQLMRSAGTTTFRIGEYTLGYTRYFSLFAPVKTGFGANFSTYTLPSAITPFYGTHPFGVNVYLHVWLNPNE